MGEILVLRLFKDNLIITCKIVDWVPVSRNVWNMHGNTQVFIVGKMEAACTHVKSINIWWILQTSH